VDFTLGFGNPDPDFGDTVYSAWVHLRRSTVVSNVWSKFWRGRLCFVRQSCQHRWLSVHGVNSALYSFGGATLQF